MTLSIVLAWVAAATAQDSFEAPGDDTVGLAWQESENRWWASDRGESRIFHCSDGDRGAWEPSPLWHGRTGHPGPLAVVGNVLLVVDEAANTIVVFDTAPSPAQEVGTIPVPLEAIREVPSITGLTWDGEAVWLSTACGLCSSFFRIDPETGEVLQSFFPACEPRGLAISPQRDLWTAAYSGPKKPSLLTRRRVTGDPTSASSSQKFFAISSPAASDPPPVDPTAITYRGGFFWIVDRASKKIARYESTDLP